MADHLIQRVLDAVEAVISAASITVTVDAVTVPVNLIIDPPSNNKLDQSQLPAIYAFAAREQIDPSSVGFLKRDLQFVIVMLARPNAKVTLQLFEMQLAVEKALHNSGDLSGLAYDSYPISSDQVLERGETVHGVRSIDYIFRCAIPRADPSL